MTLNCSLYSSVFICKMEKTIAPPHLTSELQQVNAGKTLGQALNAGPSKCWLLFVSVVPYVVVTFLGRTASGGDAEGAPKALHLQPVAGAAGRRRPRCVVGELPALLLPRGPLPPPILLCQGR